MMISKYIDRLSRFITIEYILKDRLISERKDIHLLVSDIKEEIKILETLLKEI